MFKRFSNGNASDGTLCERQAQNRIWTVMVPFRITFYFATAFESGLF